ncbi:UNVERIFIED_CONTAM: Exosome complex exonuclease RRP44A [Sesamum radiatum]|uniref:Exosome complex exonuclease RRP44A n=1 Tax=Sesamum radiatum TaxID=300843 RepID=A0AAW2V3T7_SESRA
MYYIILEQKEKPEQYHPASAPAAPVPSTPANKAPTRHTGGAAPHKPSCSPPAAAVYCLRFGAQKPRSQSATALPLASTVPGHPPLSVLARVVREHYLRDDIYCGAPFCKVCDVAAARLGSSTSTIIIVDTNVVLHQIDLLENPAIDDVVVLSVVLEEVKNKNLSVYNRLRALCSNSQRRFFVFSNEYHKYELVHFVPFISPEVCDPENAA